MIKILVVCSHNKWRSPTAEAIYRHDNRFVVRSAGLSKSSPHYLSIKDLEWADLLLYMEKEHFEKIKEIYASITFPKSVNLDIPDEYTYMQPELVDILTDKIEELTSNL